MLHNKHHLATEINNHTKLKTTSVHRNHRNDHTAISELQPNYCSPYKLHAVSFNTTYQHSYTAM